MQFTTVISALAMLAAATALPGSPKASPSIEQKNPASCNNVGGDLHCCENNLSNSGLIGINVGLNCVLSQTDCQQEQHQVCCQYDAGSFSCSAP